VTSPGHFVDAFDHGAQIVYCGMHQFASRLDSRLNRWRFIELLGLHSGLRSMVTAVSLSISAVSRPRSASVHLLVAIARPLFQDPDRVR
jgi:hypothetical protein